MQIGSMSASAMSQMHAKMFSKIDANSDGGITLEEMTTSATEKSKAKGGSEDSSKIAERFASMDANGDGSVTEEEGLSFFQSQMSSETLGGMLQAQEAGQGGGQPLGPPPSGGAGGGGQQPATFDELDTNQDGTVSLDEMLASSESEETEDTEKTSRLTELFSKMDADGDGSVTESEKSAFDEQMRAEGPPPPQGMGPQNWSSEDSEDTASTSASSANATSTVDSQTAARMAALTAQWMQSMAALMADQVENGSTVSVAA
ncbi:EF-hand domain-containing protein [Asticcacaulis sp. AND118]|uniref:EF-hand domain-containing protein n=1 Tax=Asticcacaulis sp. AND118 TaxID=2840468 RepID=UPI001CFF7754|nr:EF-hand domain-containing protein [Asticcacaulis sp. AND118]UDF03923.1 EF-hand domain-containing protein [Asticcacaulis sp. AND118]